MLGYDHDYDEECEEDLDLGRWLEMEALEIALWANLGPMVFGSRKGYLGN